MARKSLPENPKCEMTTEDGWNECHRCEALWPVGKPWTGWRPSMCVEPTKKKVSARGVRALFERLKERALERLQDPPSRASGGMGQDRGSQEGETGN
jgi:hypothetical protein